MLPVSHVCCSYKPHTPQQLRVTLLIMLQEATDTDAGGHVQHQAAGQGIRQSAQHGLVQPAIARRSGQLALQEQASDADRPDT